MNVATPNLRFKTYSKPWEVQALGKLGSFLGGGTPSTENRVYWSGDIPWVSSSDIKEGDFFGINLHRFITEDAIKNSATKKVPENSLLIVSRVGVGKFAVCRHEVCTSQDFTSFTPENCSIDFIAYQLYKNKNRLINLGQGTTIKGFTTGDLASFKLYIPEKAEQKKIADFLTSVDTKISQLTEKHRLLKDYKKGVIQQIFSQQIRFKDDDGKNFPEWEASRLGLLGSFLGGGTPSTENSAYWDGNIPWVSSSDIQDDKLFKISVSRYINSNAVKDSATKVVPRNSLLIVSRVGIGKFAVTRQDICTSQDFTNFTPHTADVVFMAYSLAHNKNKLLSIGQGTTIKGFTISDLSLLKLVVPSLKEQQKIAQFLQSLDKKIDAINKQIEQTKLFKKGLLQQMFV